MCHTFEIVSQKGKKRKNFIRFTIIYKFTKLLFTNYLQILIAAQYIHTYSLFRFFRTLMFIFSKEKREWNDDRKRIVVMELIYFTSSARYRGNFRKRAHYDCFLRGKQLK